VSWLLVIALAATGFAVGAFILKIAPRAWSSLAVALALGLAGYALQASPHLPGAPAAPRSGAELPGESLKQARQEMIAPADRSRSKMLLVADAFATRGQYVDAAAMLNGIVREDPSDSEAWLALANILVEHANGTLTEPALVAYRRAQEANPSAVAPGYFLGLAMIRQGDIFGGRNRWAQTLAERPESAADRDLLAERLYRLDVLLQQAAEAVGQ
jgi:cytochrome c-type biogenesis protein CcmH